MAKKFSELTTPEKARGGCLAAAIVGMFALVLSIATTDVPPVVPPVAPVVEKGESMRAVIAAILRATDECEGPMQSALKTMAAVSPDAQILASLDAAQVACTASAIKLPQIMTPPMSPELTQRWDMAIEKRCAPKLADNAEAVSVLVSKLRNDATPSDVVAFARRVSANIDASHACFVDLQAMAADNGTPL